MAETEYFPRIEDVVMASKILDEVIEPTPMLLNQDLTDKYGADIYLKREDLQIVRSYKIRGAYNKIRTIPPDELKYGIVCASAGNHAQGVARSHATSSTSWGPYTCLLPRRSRKSSRSGCSARTT